MTPNRNVSPVIVPLRLLIIIPLWGRCSWKRRNVLGGSDIERALREGCKPSGRRACLLVAPSRGAAVGRAVGVHGGRGCGGVASFLLGDVRRSRAARQGNRFAASCARP